MNILFNILDPFFYSYASQNRDCCWGRKFKACHQPHSILQVYCYQISINPIPSENSLPVQNRCLILEKARTEKFFAQSGFIRNPRLIRGAYSRRIVFHSIILRLAGIPGQSLTLARRKVVPRPPLLKAPSQTTNFRKTQQ